MGVRPDRILHHEVPVGKWSEEEVFGHLSETFNLACRTSPDVMEPYTIQLADLTARQEIKTFMRRALAETFTRRWPSKFQRMKEAS